MAEITGVKVTELPRLTEYDEEDLLYVVSTGVDFKMEMGGLKEFVAPEVFSGATALTPGEEGLVPTPTVQDYNKLLCGDGTWKGVDSTPTENSTNPVQSGGVYTALAAKANTSDLATVATSGSYDDLRDKPTIPDELADLADDTTHRLVTDEEKEAWDSKAEVEANPSETATADLETLKVDNVVYALAGEKVYGEASGAVASFDDGADDKPVKSLTIGIESVQTGSGDPSPQNIRPISGWTEAEVYRTGKNIFDKTNTVSGIWQADGTFDSNPLYTTIYCYVTPNTTYSIQGIDSWDNWRLCYFNTLNPTTFTKRNTNKADRFTTDSDTIMISFSPPVSGYKGGDGVQIEIGTTATDYEPYKGNTYEISWETEAGEVFGGELTVYEDGSGELSVTHKEVDLGNATWTYSSPHFEISFSDNAVGYNGDNLCSVYPKSSVNNVSTGQPDKTFVTRETFFCIRDNDYVNEQWQGDVQGFKASMAGQTLVYELATPQTYTFPSGTFPIIKTLLGENNIWNDINDTDVVYQRDLNIVINDILRRLEALENA